MALKPGDGKGSGPFCSSPRYAPSPIPTPLPFLLLRHVSFVKVLGGTLRVASRRVALSSLLGFACMLLHDGHFLRLLRMSNLIGGHYSYAACVPQNHSMPTLLSQKHTHLKFADYTANYIIFPCWFFLFVFFLLSVSSSVSSSYLKINICGNTCAAY